MNKLKMTLLLCIALNFVFVSAQSTTTRDEQKARLNNEKNVFFTRKINLTLEQAPHFWALYNEYQDNDKVLRQREKEIRQKTAKDNLAETQCKELFAELMEIDKQRYELKKKFYESLDKVLLPIQKIMFYDATREYKNVLLDKLKPEPTSSQKTSKK
jgi:Spy/CpxP family protein refolding chaperone